MPNNVPLLPCQCGSSFIEEFHTMFNGIGLKCIKCGHVEVCNKMYPQYAQKLEVIKSWNTRTEQGKEI